MTGVRHTTTGSTITGSTITTSTITTSANAISPYGRGLHR